MAIAERIAELMRDRGWSEGELSRQSGVPQPTIHRIITGDSQSPRQQNVEKLAKAFGTTSAVLWSEKEFNKATETVGPHRSETSVDELVRQLSSAKVKASPKSQAVISRLIAAAQNGSLDESAWTLIGNLLTELEKR